MQNFSTNAVAYVLACSPYSKDDYVRDYHEYVSLMQGGQ
jgi:hypothetical protein